MNFAAALATLALSGCLVAGPATHAEEVAKPMFSCSVGKKTVAVTAVGALLTYRFGTANTAEMSIVGSKAEGNVHYRSDMYAGLEQQIRFSNGRFSYTVYSVEANLQKGANAVSGLVVMDGMKRVADLSCTKFASFGAGFDLDSLPEDTEAYSAM